MKKYKILSAVVIVLFSIQGNNYAQQSNLDNYIKQAIEHSPKVLSATKLYLASEEKTNASGSLENLELKAGIFPHAMMLVNGEQIATLSVMQMFPWFGTLSNEKKEMHFMASSNKYFIEEYADEIALDVARDYYELVALKAEIRENEEKLHLNKEKQDIMLALYTTSSVGASSTTSSNSNYSFSSTSSSSNNTSSSSSMGGMNMNSVSSSSSKTKQKNSSMSDMQMSSSMSQSNGMQSILRLQLEEETLKNEKYKLLSKYAQKTTNFAILIGEENTDNIFIEDTLTIDGTDLSVSNFEEIIQNNAHLKMLSLMSQSLDAKANMNKRMSYPMFGLGLEYMINRKTDMPKMSDMNGKNMVMAMFSLSIPLNARKNKANIQSVILEKEQNNKDIEQAILDLKLRFNEIVREKEDILKDIALYTKQEKIIENILTLSAAQYTTSENSLLDILSLQEELLQFRTKKIKLISEFKTLKSEENSFFSENIKTINLEKFYK